MPRSRSEFGAQVDRDFPDGFLATFENENSEGDGYFQVYDHDDLAEVDGKPHIVLRTSEDDSGVMHQLVIEDYEVIDLEPTTARVKVEGRKRPMLWTDGMEDELRTRMRAARMTDEEFEAADRPLRGEGSRESTPDEPPAEGVTITPEQAEEDPDLRARALIGELLKDDDDA